MDPCDPTGILYTKIRSLDPENAQKIVGYLLIQDIGKKDLMRLALGPETLLQSLIFKAKADLGLSPCSLSSPSTPSSPSPFKPISRPMNINPLSQSSPRIPGNDFLDFPRNPSSPSINPKSGPFPSLDDVCGGPFFGSTVSNSNMGGSLRDTVVDSSGTGDLLDELQFNDYLSFLNDPSSKNDDFAEHSGQFGYSLSNGDAHLHRRSFSASDVCYGSEDEAFAGGFKPCMYFNKGFCKNGDNCKFVHGGFGGDNFDMSGVGSPGKIGFAYHRNEEILRVKALHQHRLAASQFMAGVPKIPYEKSMNFLLPPQNDPQRVPPLLIPEEGFSYGSPGRLERPDFLGMRFMDKSNSASRQIYLTFPADSTFKDDDVSSYFSIFGPVQDVRIPYQQKRMFGFVTFVHPETVKLILARGNPHFICDSRVLVKPYKEKGKVLEKRQQQLQQQQQIERGNFSPTSGPSGMDYRDPYDFNIGPRMLYDAHEMLMRKKLEQADLQQAIELQRRRFMNLELPDLKSECVHSHHRSLSSGSCYFSSRANQNNSIPPENAAQEIIEANRDASSGIVPQTFSRADLPQERDLHAAAANEKDYGNDYEGLDKTSLELSLPETLFASTKRDNDEDPIQVNSMFAATVSKDNDPASSVLTIN